MRTHLKASIISLVSVLTLSSCGSQADPIIVEPDLINLQAANVVADNTISGPLKFFTTVGGGTSDENYTSDGTDAKGFISVNIFINKTIFKKEVKDITFTISREQSKIPASYKKASEQDKQIIISTMQQGGTNFIYTRILGYINKLKK